MIGKRAGKVVASGKLEVAALSRNFRELSPVFPVERQHRSARERRVAKGSDFTKARARQQKKLLTLCQQALDEGHEPGDILSKGMIVGMNRLGEAFSANRAFVPEMLMAARCMSAATELLKTLMVGEGTEPVGRVCLGTVKGDMHDIGKNLVKIMMEGSGIEVFDLGVDTSAEQFVSTAVENHCGVIACSSLLTTTMEEMREVVKLVHERGLQDQIKVMVGGAPISQSFCDKIGADYYAEDAGAAAREAVAILKAQKAS